MALANQILELLALARTRANKGLISRPTAALLFVLVSSLGLAQSHDDPNWVTTWTASPSTLRDSGEDIAPLNNQTLRLVVHSSAGGSALRLRLSNTHGDQPLHVGAVSVGLQESGSTLQNQGVSTVRFGGQESITIARGADVLSDPLSFAVPALTNLLVSIYLPEPTGFITSHRLSNQTNYLSETGNHTRSTEFPVANQTPAWDVLSAIDVINPQGVSAIAMVGDSITDGWGSTDSANRRWPNYFARRLSADDSITDYAVINAGISGNRVTTEDSPQFGENLQARFERDVLANSKVSHMVLMEGINDIGMPVLARQPFIDSQEIIAGYRQIIARAQSKGIKVIAATLTPFEGAVYYTEEGEEIRQQVNAFIRDSGEFDGVIDFEKVVMDPAQPARILPTFTEDNLHPNDSGYEAMANSIDLNLFRN